MNPFTSRRDFVKAGSSLTAGALLAAPHVARAAKNDKVIKIGLVGIGGRGSGAAAQAMGADENVALTAIGDLFEDRIKLRSRILKARGRNKFQVTPETTPGLMPEGHDSGVGVVILTSPPAFRLNIWPMHRKKRSLFLRKTRGVDAPGVRKVTELAKKAKRRISTSCRVFAGGIITPSEIFKRIIGKLALMRCTAPTTVAKFGKSEKTMGGLGGSNAQLERPSLAFGDSIVEQAVTAST